VKRQQVDPAQLDGKALADWYQRTPDELAEEQSQRDRDEYEAFFGGLRPQSDDGAGAYEEARVVQPRAPGAHMPPRPAQRDRARAGPPTGAGIVPPGAGSFFEQAGVIPNPLYGPAYYSDLPQPLNVVEPELGGWFRLNDRTRVKAAELERLYAEQQRMIEGREEPEPAPHVRPADRLKDGFIPRADQLTKYDRELDATCHPYGGWERDPGFPSYSGRTQRYEEQITHAPGLDYVVRMPDGRTVKFDGCAVWDPRRQLLEAKGRGREGVLDFLLRRAGRPKMLAKDTEQAKRQIGVAEGRRVDWHAAERGYRDALKAALVDEKVPGPPTFNLHHTPAQP
jgi:hypothetical protein